MQPPPPAGPPGMGGPPRMGMTTNSSWRKRTPTPQSAMAAPRVQPVTDPFAFGRVTPQSNVPGNAPNSNMLTMPSPSPSLFAPPGPSSAADDKSLVGAQAYIPSSTPQPGAGAAMHSSGSSPLLSSGHFSNSMASAPTMPLGLSYAAPTSLHNVTGGLENPSIPSQGRSQSRQEVGNGSNVSYPPSSSQQTTAPWGSTQVVPPTSSQNFPPTSHAAYNTQYYSPPYLEVSHLPPQSTDQTYFSAPQRTAPAPYLLTGGSNHIQQQNPAAFNNTIPMDYMQNQHIEHNNWFSQAYHEPQQNPSLPSSTTLQPGAPLPIPENKPQSESAKILGSEVHSGTVSTFFKGDEAENVEILSTEQQQNSSVQSSNIPYQNSGYSAIFSSAQAQPAVSHPQTVTSPFHPAVTNTPLLTSDNSAGFQDTHGLWKVDNIDNQPTETKGGSDQRYENVENIECVQNLEVLPNEPHNNIFPTPTSFNSDGFRHGSVPGTTLAKNVPSHTEGGPNLEAPDGVSHPVRSDSVSSNYSNVSHRSLPISTRPQELVGTFIQKESGKLESESSNSFFQQIDSSPLGKDSSTQAVGQKAFHGNLSQPPTPSPPKPTGIFQASVNSSFEPVRSFVKPVDIDPSKVVGEVREANKPISNTSSNAMPAVSPGNLEQPPDNLETIFTGNANAEVFNVTSRVPSFDNPLVDKRPSSRAHGSNKKCESPATTLWAQGELPNFGGNVLLAPPAPVVYVPAKPQNEVIQPPEDGSLDTQNSRPDTGPFLTMPEENTSSENLENPPKIGDDEHPPSQASSGYASLLSSPPTDSLQNQPVLIAQPNKNYNLAQPINFSLSLPNQIKNFNSAKDPSAADKPAHANNYISAPIASPALVQPGPPLKVPNSLNNLPPGSDRFSDVFSNLPQNVMLSSATQIPLNLATDGQKNSKAEIIAIDSLKYSAPVSGTHVSVGNAAGKVYVPGSIGSNQMENTGALDFTVPRASANQNANAHAPIQIRPPVGAPNYSNQATNVPNFQPGVDINKQGFYQQVTKDVQQQPTLEALQPGPGPSHEYMTPVSQAPPGAPPGQVPPGSNLGTYPGQPEHPVPSVQHPTDLRYSSNSEPGPKSESSEQPPHPVSTSAAPANPSHPTGYPEQPRPPASQTPQQADPYYYYRGYGTYPSAYPQPYPPADPRASHLYYQDSYGAYDQAYRQYSNSGFVNSGKYPYQEPERPSSRSSHCSDRPSSRQGYNAPANYYAEYYQNQYDYGDHSRWDRYPGTYDPGYRDPRSGYWNYMYGGREDPYRKVPYGYTSRYDVYEDRWQYDPRYVGGFDDEIDARRDLAKDDFDRRSVHSEHSARSVHSERSTHSRRSSFSSRSQQSQVYKSDQDLTTNVYSNQISNPPLGDYSYSMYPNEYSTQQQLDSFQYGYTSGSEWQPVEQVPSRPLTPEKFGSPHVCARFGPGGHLIKVLPNLPSDGQPTLVEIHNMEIILQSCPEQEQMRTFPGPLVKDETHKVDVINFAQNKAKECTQNENLIDQESSRLLWDFIVLLCRQNGTVVGTDIAELLLQDHKTVWLPGKSPNEANLIDFNEPVDQEEESVASQLSFLTDTLPISGGVMEKETERFRELLLYGRKKDALESAMKHGLWGHALLLASKMDSRTHARVMTRFANSLPINDPLQTVYQLLSGRMPAAATCCGDEKWGDWRPHLAMVLSNITNNLDVPTRTMTTMGDTLASRGLLDAAHFCYIMSQVGFGVYTKKTTKLVLVGSNHSLPFAKFATNEAIQRTEAYEYAQSLGTQTISLPNIQVYKFIYACRLAEHGLSAQAFHYCEVIAKTILKHPSYYSPILVSQLLEVSLHLRFFDPQLKEKPEQELFVEPSWLIRLRHLDMQIKQGTVVYNTGRTTPQQYACSTPSSEQDHISQSDGMTAAHDPSNTDNPLLTNLLPNMIPPVQGVQLALPGPEHTAVYQPPPVSESFYSATQQTFVPPPGLSPPVSGPGFQPFNSDPVPTYTPATMEPAPTPPQPTEYTPQYAPQEQWNQEPTLQRQHSSPSKTTFQADENDFYGVMANMGPGQRSRTVSQSSSHMRRTRTTSESSTHSIGSNRRSSIGIQPSPPPPAIPETENPEPKKQLKANSSSQGGGRSWFPLKIGWLMGKGKNEAHLPDDRNKSIVWDEKKQRWVNLDEPEAESKPLPPPPLMKRPQSSSSGPGGPGGPGAPPNSSGNMFSLRAGGPRGRYVDVLNPGGTKPTGSAPAPADLFAPLAPMPIPSNLFVPNSVPEESQPSLGTDAEMVQPPNQPGLDNPSQAQFPSAVSGSDLPPSNPDDYPSGEASSSNAPAPGPPLGTVPFYNPSSFSQQTPAGGSAARPGRLGQRKYPTLK